MLLVILGALSVTSTGEAQDQPARFVRFLDFEQLSPDGTSQNTTIDNSAGTLNDFYPYGYTAAFINLSYSWRFITADTPKPQFISRAVGNNALRMNLNGSATKEKDRTEYILNSNIIGGRGYYLFYDVFIPNGIVNNVNYPLPTDWFILTQVWQSPLHSPPLSINYSADNGGELHVVGRNLDDPYEVLIRIPWKNKFNQWVKLGLYFKMGPQGEVRAFYDNKWTPEEAVPAVPFNLNFSDDCPAYCTGNFVLRFGIYRGKSLSPMFIDFDNVALYDSEPFQSPNYGCYVSLQNCPRMKKEDFIEFSDIYVPAHSDRAACLSRVNAWYGSCIKNDTTPNPRMAKIKYLSPTDPIPTPTISAHGCVITASYCPSKGFIPGQSKLDTDATANSSESACLSRVQTYWAECAQDTPDKKMCDSDILNMKITGQYFDRGMPRGAKPLDGAICTAYDSANGLAKKYNITETACTDFCTKVKEAAPPTATVADCYYYTGQSEKMLLPGRGAI